MGKNYTIKRDKTKMVYILLLFSGNSFNTKNPYFNPTQVGG